MKYRIGIIGSGSISGAHSYAFDRINESGGDIQVEKVVMCSRNVSSERCRELGWSEAEHEWEKVVARDDIDVIDICAYDSVHYPAAKAALECGKMVICEKPIADTYEQAAELAALAETKNINATVCTNYRYMHDIRCMKHMIDSGKLGEIRHVYGSFTMDWAANVNGWMNWRLDHRTSPLGTLGDLGTHLIDMCRFMGLELAEVCGMDEVYGRRRPCGENCFAETESNELSLFNARFDNGALGLFELSRVSGGGNGMIFEVHGTEGNVRWEKRNMNSLLIVPEGSWRYESKPSEEILPYDYGFEHEFIQNDTFTLLFRDFLSQNGKAPTLRDGAECSRVIDAVLKSDREKKFVKII